nr:hypothetical protein [Rhodococcus qingshengii]
MSKWARNAQALAAVAARTRDNVTAVKLELFRRSAAGGFEAVN